jgi:hypothetical protein
MIKKRETKEALRKFKEKYDEESRTEYWRSRKAYGRTVENNRCIWQVKVGECIKKLVRQKEVKKCGKP